MTTRTSVALASCRNVDVLMAHVVIIGGADVNAADKRGDTPLDVAVKRRRSSIVALLLAAGVNVERIDRQGQTPMQRATTVRSSVLWLQ